VQHINIYGLTFLYSALFICFLFLKKLDTWRKDVKSGDLKGAINEAAPDKLKPLHVSEVYFSCFAQYTNALNIDAASDASYHVI